MAIEKRWESGEELDYEYDFYDAVEAKKRAGWHSVKTHDTWEDLCPDCQKQYDRENAVGDFIGIGRL